MLGHPTDDDNLQRLMKEAGGMTLHTESINEGALLAKYGKAGTNIYHWLVDWLIEIGVQPHTLLAIQHVLGGDFKVSFIKLPPGYSIYSDDIIQKDSDQTDNLALAASNALEWMNMAFPEARIAKQLAMGLEPFEMRLITLNAERKDRPSQEEL